MTVLGQKYPKIKMGLYKAPFSVLKWTHPWNPPKKDTCLTQAQKCRNCSQPSEMAAYKNIKIPSPFSKLLCYIFISLFYFSYYIVEGIVHRLKKKIIDSEKLVWLPEGPETLLTKDMKKK